jgi:hypothetical protein
VLIQTAPWRDGQNYRNTFKFDRNLAHENIKCKAKAKNHLFVGLPLPICIYPTASTPE